MKRERKKSALIKPERQEMRGWDVLAAQGVLSEKKGTFWFALRRDDWSVHTYTVCMSISWAVMMQQVDRRLRRGSREGNSSLSLLLLLLLLLLHRQGSESAISDRTRGEQATGMQRVLRERVSACFESNFFSRQESCVFLTVCQLICEDAVRWIIA